MEKGIKKTPTGIAGVDEITGGGLPKGRTTLLMGGAGGGKTVFSMQILVNGALLYDEPGIFVAFEEKSHHLAENSLSFGWDIEQLKDKIFILDARVIPDVIASGDFDTTALLEVLKAKADRMGAKRIIFDAIDDLMAFLGNPKAERREIYRIHEWLERNGYTGIITARMEGDNLPERYAYMQFMADCALRLDYRLVDGMSARQFKVVKYRGSDFAENEFPMVIGAKGIEVASVGITGHDIRYDISYERISTGISRLDGMLDGGVYRGTSILISGTPGTSKTILCGSFIQEACLRGEKALFISFDESNTEIMRNLSSVNIELKKHVESGLLMMYSARSEARSAEEYLMIIRKLLDEHNPSCVVIDPLSAILAAPSLRKSNALPRRLFHLLKQRGITVFCSSLISEMQPEMEITQTEISTIADTWIHLSFRVQGGERNRGLTIVKSRGTKHSHQVRELYISDTGATLLDVYSAGGEVLMGTMREEKETEESFERQRVRAQLLVKQRDLEKSEIEISLRSEALQRELELKRSELDLLKQEASLREKQWDERFEARRTSRGADEDSIRME